MKGTYTFSALIRKEGDYYLSFCPELELSSQGSSVEEAVSNLKKAAELQLENSIISVPKNSFFLTTFEISLKASKTPGALRSRNNIEKRERTLQKPAAEFFNRYRYS